MKFNIIVIGVAIVFIFCGFSGCVNPKVTDYFNQEYEAYENTHLKVTTINGQIEIITWKEANISLNAVKKTQFDREELDNVEINVIETEDQIQIEAVYNGKRTTTPSVDMNIKVPEYVKIDTATTSNGAIQLSGTKGDVVATSSNGAIIIEDVDGYVSATTSNGRIEVKGSRGVKNLKSSNLGIIAEINDFKENISISTSNGGITTFINPLLNATIEMTTSYGQISISDLSLNFTISEDKHKVGQLGEGGNKIDISTANGNIKLHSL